MSSKSFMDVIPKRFIEQVATCIDISVFLQVDKTDFVKQVIQSLSLDFKAKVDVFKSVPRLFQSQFEDLIIVLENEISKMTELNKEHPEETAKLIAQNIVQAIILGVFFGILTTDESIERIAYDTIEKLKKEQVDIYNLGLEVVDMNAYWAYLIDAHDTYELKTLSVSLDWLDDIF